MKQSKSAFSFVELIIVLILLFVMLASFMPLITRKHLTPPSKVNHGTYACYRKQNNQLHQTLIKGTKVVENDIPVAKCTFDPPKKAKYFYVQLIGGGGGGRSLTDSNLNSSSYYIQNVSNNSWGNFATGCYYLWGDGDTACRGYTKSTTPYNDNLFNTPQEWEQLVKDYKIGLYATGQRGRYCTTGYSGGYGYGASCDIGKQDAESKCQANRYDATSCSDAKYPNNCYRSGSRYYYQLKCPSSDGLRCNTCKNYDFAENNCDLETHTGDGCFYEVTAMEAKDCYNQSSDSYGQPKSFYTQIPLKNLYKAHISSSVSRDDSQRYVSYNGKTVQKAWDGVGLKYTWKTNGVDQYWHVRGGAGAIKGLMQKNNPYYSDDSDQIKNSSEYCSPADTYKTVQPKSTTYDPNKLYDAYCLTSDASIAPCKQGSESSAYNGSTSFNFRYLQIGDINLSQKQVIPYGVGGKAGQIKTLLFKELKEDLPMNPGRGGAIGVQGEDTTFGGGDSGIPLKIAYGGPAGVQTYTMDVKIDPYMSNGSLQYNQPAGQWRTATTKSIATRNGEKISYNSYIKFIISYKNENIINIMKDFGKGGDGTASKTECTMGYHYQPVTLENNGSIINKIVPNGRKDIPPSKLTSSGFVCNGKYKWSSYSYSNPIDTKGISSGYWYSKTNSSIRAVQIDEPATEGGSGAVVISW